MATGTVKFFNFRKGFGYITPSEGGRDIFVDQAAVDAAGLKILTGGQEIAYEVAQNENPGPNQGKRRAVNLSLG